MAEFDSLRKQLGMGSAGAPRPSNNPFASSGPVAPAGTGFQPGFIEGFANSALSSLPEMVGYDPSPEAAAFRAQHPVGGFVSELAAMAVPYGGMEVAAAKIPRFARMIEAGGELAGNPLTAPVRNMAARELVKFAPLEVSRLAAGVVLNPDNFGHLFADVGLSMGLEAGFGALGGMLRAGGDLVPELYPVLKGGDLFAAPTLQLRSLRQGAELKNTNMGRDVAEDILAREALTETNEKLGTSKTRLAYVAPLENSNPNETGWVNFMFKPSVNEGSEAGLKRQFFREGKGGRFLGEGELAPVLAELGVTSDRDIAENFIHPRLVTVGEVGVGRMRKNLTEPVWQRVGDATFLAREANDGLFVVAKRLPRKETSGELVAAGDRFLVGKTDRPSFVLPEIDKIKEANYATWARWRPAYREPLIGTHTIFDEEQNRILHLVDGRDLLDIQKADRRTAESRIAARVARKLSDDASITSSQSAKQIASHVYDLFAPTMFREGRNTFFARHFGLMRRSAQVVETETNRLMFGKNVARSTGWGQVNQHKYVDAYGGGKTAELINSIPDAEWAKFIQGSQAKMPGERLDDLYKAGDLSDATMDIVRKLQQNDQEFLGKVVLPALEAAGEIDKFNALEGYVAPTLRLGDFGYVIRNEAGKPIHIVSGKNGKQAKAHADFVVAEAKKDGQNWHYTQQDFTSQMLSDEDHLNQLFKDVGITQGSNQNVYELVKKINQKISYLQSGTRRQGVLVGDPGFFKEREGMTLLVDPPSKKEVIQQLRAHYNRLGTVAAMKHWTERWAPEIMRMQRYEPKLWASLQEKRSQFLGVPGKITKVLNETLDPVFSHFMGKNSATKIANKTNEVLHFLNLGFVNPVFALVNSLTPLMTGVPHAAFVLNASRTAVGRLNSFMPAVGPDGIARGTISALDPLRVLWAGFKDMKQPPEELRKILGELTDNGTLHSMAIEENYGARATGPGSLREAYNSGGWLKLVSEGSTYMSRKSEELTRVLSANMGYRLGKDMLGISDQKTLQDFTQRFVENTNYLYNVTDRAKIITGPIGSMAGLFKNWQMHFLGMMTHYAGVAWNERVYSPLLWQTGSALAIGGLGSTPLAAMANGISNWYSGDKESYRWMLKNWPNMADHIWYGLPSFMGVSLQASATMPGTDVRNDISNLANMVAWERGSRVWQAGAKAWAQWDATGENGLRDPNIRDQLIEAIMPRAITKLVSSIEGDYVKSMRSGYPQVRGVSTSSRLLNAVGINPIEVEQQQYAARHLYRDQQKRKAWISGMGEAYAQAMMARDGEAMTRLVQRAVILQLPLESIMRSATNFARREQVSDILSRYDKGEGADWRQAFEEDQGQ